MKTRIFGLRTVTAIAVATFAFMTAPAHAYWQFIERPPGVEVKPSPRYSTKKQCDEALKKAEAALKKAYPDRFPLVGSCEEFR
jgi:hypothetical protein